LCSLLREDTRGAAEGTNSQLARCTQHAKESEKGNCLKV